MYANVFKGDLSTLDAYDVKGKVITWDFALLKFTLRQV